MWRIALLCSVVTLTVACTDGPGAPSVNTEGLSLQEDGDPPPPPLDGEGSVTFRRDVEELAAVAQDVCVPPPVIPVVIEGDYFQNKSERMARVHFTPVEGTGTGSGTIHETINSLDPNASGTLVVMVGDQQVQIHLIDYIGTSLFTYNRGDFFGSLAGNLVARVVACGETIPYDGTISFSWICDECGKKDF